MDILNTRRSIRKFNNKEVSKVDINKIVRVAMQAPALDVKCHGSY